MTIITMIAALTAAALSLYNLGRTMKEQHRWPFKPR